MKRLLTIVLLTVAAGAAALYIGSDRRSIQQLAPTIAPPIDTPAPIPESASRRAENGPTPETRAAESHKLTIVEAGTRKPVPFADVFVFDARAADPQMVTDLRREGFDIIEIAIRLGQRFEADSSGVARSDAEPVVGNCPLIVARKDDWIGIERAWDREIEIRRPDLRVRVVDLAGTPLVGIPVVVSKKHLDWRVYEALTSPPGGTADIRSFWFDFDVGEPLLISFGWPLDPGEPVVVARNAVPHEPVTLTLREYGAIRVIVRAPGGTPAAGGSCVLEITDRKARERLEPQDADRETMSMAQDWPHRVPLEGGRGMITPVALQQEYTVRVQVPGCAQESKTIQGPAKNGDSVDVEFTLRPEPAFVGRIVDATGEPFRDASCLMASWENREDYAMQQRCDTEGRFRYPFAWWPGGEESCLFFAIDRARDGGGWSVHAGRRRVPREVPFGDNDLGDVVIDTNDVVAGGVVLGADDQPLRGATVSVSSVDGQPWIGPFGAGATTDDRGRFLVTGGFEGARRMLIDVQDEGIFDRFECDRGARALTLRPKRLGTLRVSVLIDDALANVKLEVRLKPSIEQPMIAQDFEVTAGGLSAEFTRPEPGRFAYEESFRAGTYEVSVVAPDLREPLATIPNVVLKPGEVVRDGRLDLDLRSRLRSASVMVDCTDCSMGEVIGWRETQSGFTRIPGSGSWSSSKRACIPLLIVDNQPVNVVVACDYMRSVRAEGVVADREVRLRPGLEVNVVVDGLPEDLPDGEEIWATPSAVYESDQAPVYGSRSSGVLAGKTSFTAAYPGPHRLRLTLGTDLDFVNGRGASWALPDPFVVEDQRTQTIHLRFDRAAWERRAGADSKPARHR